MKKQRALSAQDVATPPIPQAPAARPTPPVPTSKEGAKPRPPSKDAEYQAKKDRARERRAAESNA